MVLEVVVGEKVVFELWLESMMLDVNVVVLRLCEVEEV